MQLVWSKTIWGKGLEAGNLSLITCCFIVAALGTKCDVACRRNSCLVDLLTRSILRGKNCTSDSVWVQFSRAKSNELTDEQYVFCFNHTSAFYTSNNIMKMLTNKEFKAQTGSRTGNTCHVLAPRALNMSCSFGQSARSIERKCAVI